ncbi:hypothetical protein PR048_028329 [Dryococelus australis]|uniref:CHK kinase-like domain-containing protein n=1 Tax=Dryococelus australis TaxID=614101 RepID=A0ABQ9GJ08_9NEOP|nr:hypothetical protein PR048_028329 [Dryococelus australis]
MISSGEITVELMQEMLREVEKDDTIMVLPFLYVHELNEDLHGGSCLSRVKNSVSADTVQQSSQFVREIQMFDEILPRMSVLLARALPGQQADFHAQVYYTRKNPTYLIAIDDLCPKGFKASKLFYKHAFQEDGFAEVMNMMSGKADQVRHRYNNLYEELQSVWKRDDNGFNVLNHGDFGKHNVMYRHSEPSGDVEAIMLVDFQCCSYNSPVLDLHQFIFSSASEEVIANHIDTLLREYHAELTATLAALGAPRELSITLTRLRDEFDSKMLYAFFYATCLCPLLSIDTETCPGLTPEQLFSDSGDGTDKIQSLVADFYYTSLRKLLPIFREKNIL